MLHSRSWFLRRVVCDTVLYVSTVVVWSVACRGLSLGSRLETSIIGLVACAVLGGLWTGASSALQQTEWRGEMLSMPTVPFAIAHGPYVWRLASLGVVGALGGIGSIAWSLASHQTGVTSMIRAHAVLAAVLLAAVGVGGTAAACLRSDRAAVSIGLIALTPIVTGFLWIPSALPETSGWLAVALNIHPAAGVISALGLQGILWTPYFYGKLPYAEYAVRIASPEALAAAWLGVGTAFIALHALRVRAMRLPAR
ncbi:hypothetical protein FJZ36_15380 [Candidatus Poribacteria bacterium]|nr:hypothetical protein [Candidatus Poribacteria bacterium]